MNEAVDEASPKWYKLCLPVTKHLRTRISGGLSLLILLMLVQVHFLGDPCLLHGEHTAQALESTLSCQVMNCLCFFHAVYAPVEVNFSIITQIFAQEEELSSGRRIRLLAFEIFHPPPG
jgi:hypothetical protein